MGCSDCSTTTDRVPGEGRQVRRGAAAVLRDRGPDRELPTRRVPVLRVPAWAGADRPRAVPAGADRPRCEQAGIGREVEFAIKPKLAQHMLARLLAEHGRQAMPWFTADEAYGDNPGLRDWLHEQDLNYVMAVSCDARFTPTGRRRADELAAAAPIRGWQRLLAGEGSKGHRLYDWLLLDPGSRSDTDGADVAESLEATEGAETRNTSSVA